MNFITAAHAQSFGGPSACCPDPGEPSITGLIVGVVVIGVALWLLIASLRGDKP